MQVVEFRPDLLPDLTRLINEQTASIPPGCAFSEAQVALTIEQAASLWGMHFPDDHDLYDVRTLCVLQRRELVAAAQWLMPRQRRDVCSLLWIVAKPNQRNALRTLLHLIEKQASGEAFGLIELGRFSFGLGWFGIPALWSHIIDAMIEAGFEHTETWTLMHGSTNAQKEPPLPRYVKLAWDMNKPALEWKLTAYLGDIPIGECQVWGAPDHFEGCEMFEQWATIEWVEVEGEYQRQGIATRLISEQIRFHSRRGVSHLMAWMRKGNLAARGLNESLGFVTEFDLAVLQKRVAWF
jgi:GNAT superfamily N-acetyltransferase